MMNLHPLVEFAKNQIKRDEQMVHLFSEDVPDRGLIEEFLSPNGRCPHAYVLACLMDRQIKAENAWLIPWEIKKHLGCFDIETLKCVSQERWKQIFSTVSRHRFKNEMAENFHAAVARIVEVYGGDARNIWNDRPSSAELVCRFLGFKGAGVKIATMATNILVRQYKIGVTDRCGIDVSPDVHIMRVFNRIGLVDERNRDLVIYKARALNPEYPGVVDYSCWYVGKNYCHERGPECDECPFGGCASAKFKWMRDEHLSLKGFCCSYRESRDRASSGPAKDDGIQEGSGTPSKTRLVRQAKLDWIIGMKGVRITGFQGLPRVRPSCKSKLYK